MLNHSLDLVCIYIIYIQYIYIYIYIYILWEEVNVKQAILKISCWRTNNLSARYNDHQKIYSVMLSLI